ncbi:MAG: HIT family protein [Patescibacteria group bacterium]|jgi:histidine triad (HIT) family protein
MNKDCIFCKIIKGELPSYKIYEDDKVLVFLDINPINKGHALVVPKEHYESILETPDDLVQHIAVAVKKISKAVMGATGAHACNIGINNGAESGQIVFHTHWHIMPRFKGDGYELWKGKDSAYMAGEAEDTAERIKNALK